MDFKDELAAIVRAQQENEPLGEEIIAHVLSALKKQGTVGYIVFVTENGDNGLVCLGPNPGDLPGLSYAHRVANKLIDELMYSSVEEQNDEG